MSMMKNARARNLAPYIALAVFGCAVGTLCYFRAIASSSTSKEADGGYVKVRSGLPYTAEIPGEMGSSFYGVHMVFFETTAHFMLLSLDEDNPLERAKIVQDFKKGSVLPAGDVMYRITDIRPHKGRHVITLTRFPVSIDGFTPTKGSVGLVNDADCVIGGEVPGKMGGGVRFKSKIIDIDGAPACEVSIYDTLNGIRNDSERCLSVLTVKEGEMFQLSPGLRMQLGNIVPLDKERKFGGWAEYVPIVEPAKNAEEPAR